MVFEPANGADLHDFGSEPDAREGKKIEDGRELSCRSQCSTCSKLSLEMAQKWKTGPGNVYLCLAEGLTCCQFIYK